jgi:hypothetical protein
MNDVELAVLGEIVRDITHHSNATLSNNLGIDKDKVSRATVKLAAQGKIKREVTGRSVRYTRIEAEDPFAGIPNADDSERHQFDAPEPAKPLIKLAIARTPSNDPEVHAEGCADIKRGLKSGKYVNDTMHIEVESVEDAARWFWEDFLPGGCAYGESDPDNPMTDDDAQGYTVYLPCTGRKDTLPTPPAKRSAKQDLARRVVEAVAALNLSDDEAKIAAQWLHHLPTGTDGSDARYWPANMPRPNRSDWK